MGRMSVSEPICRSSSLKLPLEPLLHTQKESRRRPKRVKPVSRTCIGRNGVLKITDHGEHETSPDDIDGDDVERMAVEENVTEPEQVSLPSRRRRQRKGKMEVDPGVPPAQAIFVISSAWSLPTASALFDILPENSYDPAIRSLVDPFEDSRHLMLATYKLALVTRGRVGEAKRALADAFMEEDGFDEEVATDIIRRLADRFANA
jgi:hypothetical protein